MIWEQFVIVDDVKLMFNKKQKPLIYNSFKINCNQKMNIAKVVFLTEKRSISYDTLYKNIIAVDSEKNFDR